MLQMKVDLFPHEDRKSKSTILSMTVTNDGSSVDPNIGNYIVKAKKDKQTRYYLIQGVQRRDIVNFMNDIMSKLSKEKWT